MPEQDMDWWPNCGIPDCPNKACLRLKSQYCWPHTHDHLLARLMLHAAKGGDVETFRLEVEAHYIIKELIREREELLKEITDLKKELLERPIWISSDYTQRGE